MNTENTTTTRSSLRRRAFRATRAGLLTGLTALSTLCLPATQALGVIYPVGAGSSHSLYIKNPIANPFNYGENSVFGMGQQTHHELGDFMFSLWDTPRAVGCYNLGNYPYPPHTLYTALSVTGGRNHSVAIRNDGVVVAWGDGSYGQLGHGDYLAWTCASQNQPAWRFSNPRVVSTRAFAIAAGDYHTYAITGYTAGYTQIRSWGRSNAGQVGNGKAMGTNYPTPDCVRNNVYPVGACLTAVRSVAAGEAHGVAATFDGKVHSWGSDSDGQRGEPGVSGDRSWALEVPGIDNVISVAARGYITLAPCGAGDDSSPSMTATSGSVAAPRRPRFRVSPALPRSQRGAITRWRSPLTAGSGAGVTTRMAASATLP